MPRHCNRITAKWQEKYPEFQSIDVLSGALSALPIMPQGGAASQRHRTLRRRGPGLVASPALGERRGRFSEQLPVLWYSDRHTSPKALAATRENKLGGPAAHHR